MRISIQLDIKIEDQDKLIRASGVAVPAAGGALVYPTDDVRVNNVVVLRLLQVLPDFSDAGFTVTRILAEE